MFVNGLFFSLIFVLMQITTLPSQRLQWTNVPNRIDDGRVKKQKQPQLNSIQVQRNIRLSILCGTEDTSNERKNA